MKQRAIYLRVDQVRRLDHWCQSLRDSFAAPVYLVGSSMDRDDWRDVDIRIVLSDAAAEAIPLQRLDLNTMLSRWGEQQTGLPIDCQVQSRAESAEFDGFIRNPRGITPRKESEPK